MSCLVVGAGLAGSLLALALAERGESVTLIDAGPLRRASAWTYGVVLPQAMPAWRELQGRYGDLGLRPLPVRLQGRAPWRRWLPPLPLARLDPLVLTGALPQALARAGVHSRRAGVREPLLRRGNRWQLPLEGGGCAEADRVVLAAGAGCRDLWPALPASLQVSWAGVLELASLPPVPGLPTGGALLPARFQRLALERGGPQQRREAWVVDAGLVPCGAGWLAGQISLLQASAGAQDRCLGNGPDSAVMEARLRQGLAARLSPALADWPGRYRQVPVSFCSDGRPLVGPVAWAPGLWVCAGFSGAFSQAPGAVARLARALTATSTATGSAQL